MNGEHDILCGERRQSTRFEKMPDEDFAAVWRPGDEAALAEVHDESLGGLGLVLDAKCGIGLGCHVQIVYAGGCYLAQARHVEPWRDGQLLVGFQCEPVPPAATPAVGVAKRGDSD